MRTPLKEGKEGRWVYEATRVRDYTTAKCRVWDLEGKYREEGHSITNGSNPD